METEDSLKPSLIGKKRTHPNVEHNSNATKKHIQEVARSREDWMRVHEGEADLADLITLARLHSYIGTSAMKTLPRINEIPAFHKLSLGEVGPSQSFEFIDMAKERIQQIRQALVA